MSDDNAPNGTSSGPSHHAFTVRESKDGKSFFNRVGSAFEHKDGQGFNITLEAVPVDGKITLRKPIENRAP